MTVAEILSKVGETEEEALREHALLLCMAKISRYEAECGSYAGKYGQDLNVFREGTEKNEEVFEREDDLMDWEFASQSLEWWTSRLKELHNAG
ncbi:MAG: hypothetical protein EOM20_17050 [Spartobacteria bacterium]|nr:hypothetical protein [Spartobacteria bacterium]